MASNEQDILPEFEDPNISSCDFAPQEPHQFNSQKVCRFDLLPDNSAISDCASNGGSVLYSRTFGIETACSTALSPRTRNGIKLTHYPRREDINTNILPSPKQDNFPAIRKGLVNHPTDVYINSDSCDEDEFQHCDCELDGCRKRPVLQNNPSTIPSNNIGNCSHPAPLKRLQNFNRRDRHSCSKHGYAPKQPSVADGNSNCCSKPCSSLAKNTNGSSSSQFVDVPNEIEISSESLVPRPNSDVWVYLREQDEKLNKLQDQISVFLQKDSPNHMVQSAVKDNSGLPENGMVEVKPCSQGFEVCETNKSGKELDQAFILRYIKDHSAQIQNLQDQVSLLLKRTEELESFHMANSRGSFTPEPITFTNSNQNGSIKNHGNADFLLGTDTNESKLMYNQQVQAKKTSASTMTSLTFSGNDKVVYRKMSTVVTDFSNCQKDVSIQCLAADMQGKEIRNGKSYSPSNNKEAYMPLDIRDTTPKSSDSKKQKLPMAQKQSSSSQRVRGEQGFYKHNGQVNSSPDCNINVQSLPDHIRGCDSKSPSPRFDSDRENKLTNEVRSPNEKIIPLYESIVRNIDQLILDKDEQRDSSPSGAKSLPKTRPTRHSASKSKKTPPVHLSPPKRKSKFRSFSRSSTSSSTSADSVNTEESESDELDPRITFHDSPTQLKYGISSPNLSLGTKQYLENYGLLCRKSSSHNNGQGIMSSKKSKSPGCRRRLR